MRILFVCLGASIGRQFEFVQQTWINRSNFDGLYDESGALVGAPHVRPPNAGAGFTFTAPGPVVGRRIAVRVGHEFFAE